MTSTDPAPAPTLTRTTARPGYDGDAQPRMAFFTDTTVCIGCKACEVACKEWNDIPETLMEFTGNSYDNTGGLGADAWRHVAFIEQRLPRIREQAESGLFTEGDRSGGATDIDITRVGTGGFADDVPTTVGLGGLEVPRGSSADTEFRWLMSSDVCKHCTSAACLDVCPTGSLFKTEFDTVVVQEDICNGCGYCIPACPYGVIDQRKGDGRAWKCTMCYDRLRGGQEPACAQACPTDSINFGTLDDMQQLARDRYHTVVDAGLPGARLYGDGPSGGVDGTGAIFLLLDEPEVYGLPPDPIVTTRDLLQMWRTAVVAAAAVVAATIGAFLGTRS